MAENEEQDVQDVELQGMLVKRLFVAGALVGVLLAVLAFFDYLATPDEAPDLPVYTRPVPVAPKKELSQPVTPVPEELVPPLETAAPDTAAPVEVPPAPEVSAQPELAPPPTVPAVLITKPALPANGGTVAAVTIKPAPQVTPAVPEGTAAPSIVTPVVPAPSAVQPTATVRTKSPPESAPPAPPLLSPAKPAAGYLVQAGVFTSTRSAEELHAKLALNGIPSTLETRVQIGPFKNRQEAEIARQKLKALGIDSLMIPPTGRR